jgi:site-specific DNA recombinase
MTLDIPRRAGIYVRISRDPEGARAGVTRQREDCEAWAKSKGVEVVDVYEDNDISAYSGKPRPGYIRLCRDIKEGVIDIVIVWHGDRLHRSPAELETFIPLVEAANAQVVVVTGSTLDLSTSDGRLVARMVGAVARKESEDKSRRIRRQAKQAATEGKRSGGGTRGYGYSPDHTKVILKEAKIIKEAAERVLAGESLRSICVDLNDRSVPTVTNKSWRTQVLKEILISGRISGQREHHGEIVAKGAWPAIITPPMTSRLRAILKDPARRTNQGARSYMLKGLLRCGKCGARLVARPTDTKQRKYTCVSGPNYQGCGRCAVLAKPIEELVTNAVLDYLDSPAVYSALANASPGQADLESLIADIDADRLQLDELTAMWSERKITARQWMMANQQISSRVEAAERRLATLTDTSAVTGYIGDSEALRGKWMTLPIDRKRAIIATVVESILVGPAIRGRNRFDPGRITINFIS